MSGPLNHLVCPRSARGGLAAHRPREAISDRERGVPLGQPLGTPCRRGGNPPGRTDCPARPAGGGSAEFRRPRLRKWLVTVVCEAPHSVAAINRCQGALR